MARADSSFEAGDPFFGDRAHIARQATAAISPGVQAALPALAPTPDASRKHVVFIGVDGAQYDQILKTAPQMLKGLDTIEAYTGGILDARTEQPTLSAPGWSTLLTGVWANKHGVTENNGEPIRARVDSLFERIDDAQLGSMASIVHWPDINTGHFAREMGYLSAPSIVEYQADGISDARVTSKVIKLINGVAPVFTFAQLDDVDETGHAYGFGKEYTQALKVAGHEIDQIREAVAAREASHPGEDWMIIISTDHGREKSGYGHGGQSDSERQTFIASDEVLNAHDTPPNTSVAATILDFLGLDASGIRGPSLLEHDSSVFGGSVFSSGSTESHHSPATLGFAHVTTSASPHADSIHLALA